MDETLDRIIQDSGPMWLSVAERSKSPVNVRTPDSKSGEMYELTMPEGESHPFWRVRVREMTWEEREGYGMALALNKLHPFGFDMSRGEGGHLTVAAHVYNGRRTAWSDSVPRRRTD